VINCFQTLLSDSTCAATTRGDRRRLPQEADCGSHRAAQGEAVQVDPIKPKLKPPGSWNEALETNIRYSAFNLCFQFPLSPLQQGGEACAAWPKALAYGGEYPTHFRRHRRRRQRRQGRAVQVDGIKTRVRKHLCFQRLTPGAYTRRLTFRLNVSAFCGIGGAFRGC